MKDKKESIKKLPQKVLDAFNKVEIHECSMCGAFLTGDEYKQFEGVCKKHWDY